MIRDANRHWGDWKSSELTGRHHAVDALFGQSDSVPVGPRASFEGEERRGA